MEDLETIPDDELDQLRRDTLAEQERRDKVERGLALIGSAIRDYADAARLDLPELDDTELGQKAIEGIT